MHKFVELLAIQALGRQDIPHDALVHFPLLAPMAEGIYDVLCTIPCDTNIPMSQPGQAPWQAPQKNSLLVITKIMCARPCEKSIITEWRCSLLRPMQCSSTTCSWTYATNLMCSTNVTSGRPPEAASSTARKPDIGQANSEPSPIIAPATSSWNSDEPWT